MATNYPGPYELRINYATIFAAVGYEHQLRLSFNADSEGDPGDDFEDWTVLKRNSTAESLEQVTLDLLDLLYPIWHTTTDFVSAELWKYTPGTFNAAFQSSLPIGESGTSENPVVADSQAIITFRSTLGGYAKLDMRHVSTDPGPFQLYPFSGGGYNNLATFVAAETSGFIARDNGFLFVPYKFLPGTNEKMFKNRWR